MAALLKYSKFKVHNENSDHAANRNDRIHIRCGGRDFSRKIIVFPCGDVGIQCINIMERIYGLESAYVIDNHKCKYSTKIKPITFLKDIDRNEYVLILALTNPDIYENLRSNVLQYFSI